MQAAFTKFTLKTDLLLLLALFIWINAFPQEYGLLFHSHDLSKDKRTGIVLTPDKDFIFNNEFKLSFDLSTHHIHRFRYGYVFRIILNGQNNIDLLYGNSSGGEMDLPFSDEGYYIFEYNIKQILNHKRE
jgi:hypothetical protein